MEKEIVRSLAIILFRVTLLAGFMAGTFCRICAAADVSVAARVASVPARTLQLILEDPVRPDGRRWIVWDEGIGDTQTAHVALCNMAGKCKWSHTWPDAYAPTIQYMGSWSTQKTSLFLIIFSEGAEAQTAVVVELPVAQTPRLVDQHDGAWIALAPGEDYLELRAGSGAGSSLECLRWNGESMRLRNTPCTSMK